MGVSGVLALIASAALIGGWAAFYVIKLKPAGASLKVTWGSLVIALVLATGAVGPAAQNTVFILNLTVPNWQFSTIQAALDGAPNGANVHIKPGVYHETVFVRKQLQIYGSEDNGGVVIDGEQFQALDPAGGAVGLVNYENGGGGWLQHVRLIGGHAGLVGVDDPASLVIKDVEVTGSRLGMLWDSAAKLTVSHITIHGTKSNGFVNLKGHQSFGEFGILFEGGIGMYIANADDVQLSDIDVSNNDSVGVYIRKAVVQIDGVVISNNNVAGIWASDSYLALSSMYIHSNHADPESGRFGDGVAVLLGNADLDIVQSSYNERCGISNFGANITVTKTLSQGNLFHFCGEVVPTSTLSPGLPPQQTDFNYDDQGGNYCFNDQVEVVCQVTSPGLEPPEPIPPTQ